MRNSSFAALLAGLSAATLACSSDSPEPTSLTPIDNAAAAVTLPKVTPQSSGTTNRLQAISPVTNRIAWASGAGGTFAVPTDGGAHWRSGVVPGASDLQFRDVQGVSANVAYLMSVPGDDGTPSRIYKTTNGGDTWKLQFQSNISTSFYDCFAFWDRDRGIAFSDPVGNGIIPALRVTDGKHWTNIGGRLPKARSGEFGFAASGEGQSPKRRFGSKLTRQPACRARVAASSVAERLGSPMRVIEPKVRRSPAAKGRGLPGSSLDPFSSEPLKLPVSITR